MNVKDNGLHRLDQRIKTFTDWIEEWQPSPTGSRDNSLHPAKTRQAKENGIRS